MNVPFLDAHAMARRLSMAGAIEAIAQALVAAVDPESDPPRQVVATPAGQLLVMPAATPRGTGVKIVSVAPANPARGLPRIQGVHVHFDADTLSPLALMDGAALTALRTPAVSGVAIDRLAAPGARRLLVYGSGPQAWGHVLAARALRELSEIEVVARDPARLERFVVRCHAEGIAAHVAGERAVERADIICCCTSARAPLFDGARVAPHALVVAIGSHEPDAREVDATLVARSTVVVESRAAALREAGDIVLAIAAGATRADALVTLADVVRGAPVVSRERPRLFKSVGMAWQDAVVAAAIHGAA